MKKTIALVLALICALTAFLTLAASCGGEEAPAGKTYGVAFGGVTLTPDMDIATVLSSVTDTYKYSESSACPPFSGTEKRFFCGEDHDLLEGRQGSHHGHLPEGR